MADAMVHHHGMTAFSSFFMAGFECSSHRRWDKRRLDLIAATGHDRHAEQDYRRCADAGLTTVRDGLRWHLIERQRGRYDWSSWLRMIEAAERAQVEVIWDLFHYGHPDFTDVRTDDFPAVYAEFAAAAAAVHRQATDRPIACCLVNEISFYSWAIDTGHFSKAYRSDRPGFVKRNLVRAAIAGAKAIDDERVRFVWAEPLINVSPYDPLKKKDVAHAEGATRAQYEAVDYLRGAVDSDLGGHPAMVTAVGLNYYPQNQWYVDGATIPLGHHAYRPLSDLIFMAWKHYDRPLFLAETGAEGSGRVAWLHYVCDEVRIAMARGVPFLGICLYPITDYPGWENGRMASTGLFGPIGGGGKREIYQPLLEEIERQKALFDAFAATRAAEGKA